MILKQHASRCFIAELFARADHESICSPGSRAPGPPLGRKFGWLQDQRNFFWQKKFKLRGRDLNQRHQAFAGASACAAGELTESPEWLELIMLLAPLVLCPPFAPTLPSDRTKVLSVQPSLTSRTI